MLKRSFFEITLTNSEPLRIGGPDDPLSGADNPIARVGNKIVIPGSSLKGALRAEIERFLIATHYHSDKWSPGKEAFQPCIPGDKPSIDEQALIREGKYRLDGNCHYPCKPKCRMNHSICPACYLLGAMGLEGFIRVPFLVAEVAHGKLYSSRIDRATRTVAERTNRPYELVPMDTKFKGTLEVLVQDDLLGWRLGSPRSLGDRTSGDKWLQNGKNLSAEEIIQTVILDRLQAIRLLGGYKSKGFGRVKIEVKPLKE